MKSLCADQTFLFFEFVYVLSAFVFACGIQCQENSSVKIFQFQSALYYANCEYFITLLYKQTTLNPRELKMQQQQAEKILEQLAQVKEVCVGV